MVQEVWWAPGPVWMGAENLAPPLGFDPRTVQPVASRYTVCHQYGMSPLVYHTTTVYLFDYQFHTHATIACVCD